MAQGRGHRLEGQKPVPFRSPVDAVVRILAEQYITFPRFVLSGQFAAACGARPRSLSGFASGLLPATSADTTGSTGRR